MKTDLEKIDFYYNECRELQKENENLKKDKKELLQLFKNYKEVLTEQESELKEVIKFYEKS